MTNEMSEMELLKDFSFNFKAVLRENHITQSDLAFEMGVHRSTIARYANGERLPAIKEFMNMVRALHCNPEDLLPFGYRIV